MDCDVSYANTIIKEHYLYVGIQLTLVPAKSEYSKPK